MSAEDRLLGALAPIEGEILQVTRDYVSLRPGAVWVDVDEVMRATTAEYTALSLLDGALLEGLEGIDPAFDGWLAAERERLCDRARMVAETLLRKQVEPDAAILAAQRLLQIDRAHEGAWPTLMRSHATRGEKGMAIQAYDRCRTALTELMDAAPSQETQQLLIPMGVPPALPGRHSKFDVCGSSPRLSIDETPPREPPKHTNLELHRWTSWRA